MHGTLKTITWQGFNGNLDELLKLIQTNWNYTFCIG